MAITICISLGILLFFGLIGYPFVALFFKNNNEEELLDSIVVVAFSLLIGFGISSFSAATSYGLIGINFYFSILMSVAIISWSIYLFKNKVHKFRYKKFNAADSLISIPILISIYLTSSQWNGFLKPIVKVSQGPDTSQNMMAALGAEKIGNTWFASLKSIKDFLNVNNFEQAAIGQFQVPSSIHGAVYDYLTFGVRWGLTIPYSQFLKLFGRQAILWETGIILLVSLISISLIIYAIGKLLSKNILFPTILSTSIILNSALLTQYLNGGMSQIVGSIGLVGLFLVSVKILSDQKKNLIPKNNLGILVVSVSCWLTSVVTYIDSTFIFILASTIWLCLLYFSNKKYSKDLTKLFFKSGIISIFFMPTVVYINFISIKLRSQAATGTGSDIQIWRLPSAHFGFLNIFSAAKISSLSYLLSLVIFILIIMILIYSLKTIKTEKELVLLGISSLITIFIGYMISINGKGRTPYIYDKISIYLSVFVVSAVYISLEKLRSIYLKTLKAKFALLVMSTLTIMCLISSVNFMQTYFNIYNTTLIPSEIGGLLNDKSTQNYMSTNNYIMPYKPTYNYANLLGAEYWISKAPNDLKIDDRLNNKLHLLCFYGDASCNPVTPLIENSPLQKYGIVEFTSPITTAEFAKLTIQEKYDFGFEVFGMAPQVIPKKFMGGNPYFNK